MSHEPRTLFVAWRTLESGLMHPVGRLVERASESSRFEFRYVEGVRDALADGFVPFLEFPEIEAVYLSDELFPIFDNRLMKSSRSDYEGYVARLGLDPRSAEPIQLLMRSAGVRATDTVELFPPPAHDPKTGAAVWHFFARGVRHVPHAGPRILVLTPIPPAPVQQRLLCRLEARWSNGFQPFSTARYQPVPEKSKRVSPRPVRVSIRADAPKSGSG